MSHPTRELTFRKISDRLRAYGVDQISVRFALTQSILDEAEKLGDESQLMANASQVFNHHQEQINEAIRRKAQLPNNVQGNAQAILILQESDVNAIWTASMKSPNALEILLSQAELEPPVVTGPALSRSALGAPQIDFGALQDTTNNTLAVLNRWPKVRFAGFMAVLVGITAFIVSTAR